MLLLFIIFPTHKKPNKYYFHSQMKIALVIAAFCIVACLGESESTENREKRQTKGRFLSLPVPQKCATRKFSIE